MERSRDEIKTLAVNLGVRADVLEKVVRLLDVLRRLQEDEDVRMAYALKGGTALNVFWLALPRLSVDIDINFVAAVSPGELAERRPIFEQRVMLACQLAGCRALRSPGQHAGGKYRLRFASLFGGEQNLELDISYVARVPLFDLIQRKAVLPGFEGNFVVTYKLQELAAGKFSALVSRTVARDRYDAVGLLQREPALLEDPEFRLAFVCLGAASRDDVRELDGELPPLDAQEVRSKLVPVLREAHEPLAADAVRLARHLDRTLSGVARRLANWSDTERAFIDALSDRGELKPELLSSDPKLQHRIAAQPMLRWKQKNVREHRGLPAVRHEES